MVFWLAKSSFYFRSTLLIYHFSTLETMTNTVNCFKSKILFDFMALCNVDLLDYKWWRVHIKYVKAFQCFVTATYSKNVVDVYYPAFPVRLNPELGAPANHHSMTIICLLCPGTDINMLG